MKPEIKQIVGHRDIAPPARFEYEGTLYVSLEEAIYLEGSARLTPILVRLRQRIQKKPFMEQ